MKTFIKPIQFILVLAFFLVNLPQTKSQTAVSNFFPDINILEFDNPAPGYYFLAAKGITDPNASLYIGIVDNYGTPVFFRKMARASGSMRLMSDGRIAYLNGVPRKLIILNDMLEVETRFSIEGYDVNGHDWSYDDEGNILLMGEVNRYIDMSQLIEGGNTNAEVLDVIIQEFDKEGTLKYTWNSADHFDLFDGNENSDYLDYTEAQLDYVHANSVDFDSDTSFILSCRHMDEVTKVDRRTGEIIWRLGGKNNQFTFINDPIGFSHQHSISMLEGGRLMIFDNGNLHDPQVSSSVIYQIDEENKTATLLNRYGRTPSVYCNHVSGTQMVYNGNVINYWGVYWPSATEFHPDGSVALEMDFTQHSHSPRILKYLWETKVFESDRDTINYGRVENSQAVAENIVLTNNKSEDLVLTGFTAHANLFTVSNAFPITIPAGKSTTLEILFNAHEANQGNYEDLLTISADTDTERIARQVWVFAEKTTDITGLEDQEKKISTFTIAPSPAKGTITLTTFDAKNKKIEIHSIRGKLIYSSQTNAEMKCQIDISSYKNGIYLVSLIDENNQKQTQKLIIQN